MKTHTNIEAHLDKWIKIGLSTDPIDEAELEKAIKLCYRIAELDPPSEIIRFGNPQSMLEEAAEIDERSFKDQVWNQIWNQVEYQIENQIRHQVGYQIRNKIWNRVGNKIWNKIWNQVGNQICFGQHDAHWLALYTFFDHLPIIRKLDGLVAMTKNSGWWIPYKDKILVSEKPSKLIWRDEKCIHIEFADGWTVSKLSPIERLSLV